MISDVSYVIALPSSSIRTVKAAGLIEVVATHELVQRAGRTPVALHCAATIKLSEGSRVVVGVKCLWFLLAGRRYENWERRSLGFGIWTDQQFIVVIFFIHKSFGIRNNPLPSNVLC